MKQIYSYDEAKNVSDDETERFMYYFHPKIMNGSKRMYKAMIKGDQIELDEKLMTELRSRTWTTDDCYTIVSMSPEKICVYYK